MSEAAPRASNQETATGKQRVDAEFRRWSLAMGLCADEVARIMGETAADEPCPARSKIPRSGEHFSQFGRESFLE